MGGTQPQQMPEERLAIEPLAGYVPEIGRALWMLEDCRRCTKETLAGIADATIDWTPPSGGNTIGSLLYHIALIELDWLCNEVLQLAEPWPEEITRLLPWDVRDAQGRLTVAQGFPFAAHLDRLDAARDQLLAAFRSMTLDEFRRPRILPQYAVTPEWVLHHLAQHEGEHRGHIALTRSWAEGTPAPL